MYKFATTSQFALLFACACSQTTSTQGINEAADDNSTHSAGTAGSSTVRGSTYSNTGGRSEGALSVGGTASGTDVTRGGSGNGGLASSNLLGTSGTVLALSSGGITSSATQSITAGAGITHGPSGGDFGSSHSAAGAATTGGTRSYGGSSGSLSLPGGTSAVGSVPGAGGVGVAGGATVNGGVTSYAGSPAGGLPATGGAPATGGKSGCNTDDECINPHLPTCAATCQASVCKTSVLSDLGSARQSGDKGNVMPRTGFWDENGVPYLVYPLATQPMAVNLHQLNSSGMLLSSTPSYYSLPAAITNVDTLTATMSGSTLALGWHSWRPSEEALTTELGITDTNGTASTPMLLGSASDHDKYPNETVPLVIYPLAARLWAIVIHGGGPAYVWQGYVADVSTPATIPPVLEFANTPRSVSRTTGSAVPQAAAVLNNTLFVTGYSQEWDRYTPNAVYLVLGRYDASTLAAKTPTTIPLSVNGVTTESGYQRTPAITRLGSKVAVMWTEFTAPSFESMLLGYAVVDENGDAVVVPNAVPSKVIPKALVQAPSGAALLIASRVDTLGTTPTHTLVAQRLDASLKFVGAAYPINTPSQNEPLDVQAHRSLDGKQVLITFKQDFAQHRILHTELCQ